MKLKNFKCLLLASLVIPAMAGRASAQFPSTPLRITTMGDSITFGFLYQPFLREKLVTEGANYTFVGSQHNQKINNPQIIPTTPEWHEGHSGWKIEQINANVNTWLTNSNANVVMLQIGINNMDHGMGGLSATPGATLDSINKRTFMTEQVSELYDKILNHANQPTLIVAKIPGVGLGNPSYQSNNNDCDSRVKEYNDIIAAAVKTRQDAGKKIRLVDNYSGNNRAYGTGPAYTWGDQASQTGDWVHPSQASMAYKNMATNFFNGLKDALGVPASTRTDRTLETGTMTARGGSGDGGPSMAFDNNTNTKWFDGNNATSWIQFEFASPHIINRYVITSGGDVPDRDPKNWTLQGSNDGSSFVNLDSQTEQFFVEQPYSDLRKYPKMYSFTNGTAYKYYRLNITANKGGGAGIQISELRLWGPTDISFSNPGFESNTGQTPIDWRTWANPTANEAADTADPQGPRSGNNRLTHWMPNNAYQVYTWRTITGLPNGSYTLKAWTMSSGGQAAATMTVKNPSGGYPVSTSIPAGGSSYTQRSATFSISNQTGATGQAEIGFWSNAAAGQWIIVDDVTLTRN